MNRKYFWIAALPLLAMLFAFTAKKIKLERQNINRRVIMLVPSDFAKLSEDDIVKDYGMQKIPLAMYANDIGDITVTVSETIDSLGNSSSLVFNSAKKGGKTAHDLEIEKSFRKSSIMSSFEKVTFLKDEVKELHKVPFIVLEFESKLVGKNKHEEDVETEMYNYILYGYRKNRSYIINIACPLHKKAEWKPHFDAMVESVNI